VPCYEPLRAVLVGGPQGRTLFFKPHPKGDAISLPCGRCIGCRLERARQWAVRIMHETQMHDQSCFITLTYDDDHLPKDGSIDVRTCQLFLKRLRFALSSRKIRFFLCGEYGEKLGRPHYHAIIFGYDFPDKVKLTTSSASGFAHFTSKELTDLWGQGRCDVGAVSFDSACYVANYATKKITGDKADEHYQGRTPEFLLMSRKPGIGRSWFDSFSGDVYPSDEIVVRGKSGRPPRYYDNVHRKADPVGFERVSDKRRLVADELQKLVLKSGHVVEVAPSRNARRLQVRKKVAEAKSLLKLRRMEKS